MNYIFYLVLVFSLRSSILSLGSRNETQICKIKMRKASGLTSQGALRWKRGYKKEYTWHYVIFCLNDPLLFFQVIVNGKGVCSVDVQNTPKRTSIICSYDVFTLTKFNGMSQKYICQTAKKLATFLLIFWSVIFRSVICLKTDCFQRIIPSELLHAQS